MQTWWIGRSRQGLGRAGRVYRNSCQSRQAMNLQTFLPLALSEGIFGRPVWTRCRIPVRLDEDALYISLSVDFGIMWLSMKGRALVVAVAIRYSTRNASDATGDDPQGIAEAPIDPRQQSGC